MLRRRSGLDLARVWYGLSRLLDVDAVDLPAVGTVVLEHVGSGDWRAGVEMATGSGAVREVRVAIGAPWDIGPRERSEQVFTLVTALLRVAADSTGEVEVVHAQPAGLDAP